MRLRPVSYTHLIIKDTSAYVNIDTVKSNIDKRFYWDKKDKKLFFTNATEVYYVDESQPTVIHGNTDETVNYKVFLKEKKKCYVNLQFIQKFVDLDSKITKKSGKAPAIISLKYTSGEKTTFKTDSEIEMRTKMCIRDSVHACGRCCYLCKTCR